MIKKTLWTLVILILGYFSFLYFTYYHGGGGFGPRKPFKFDSNIVFSHRGVPYEGLENSPKAFKNSKDLGFKAIETDVRLTKEGIPIVFHDFECERLLNIEGTLDDYSWEELRKKNLYHKGKPTSYKIQTLESFLQQEAYSDFLYLDIKESSHAMADALIKILEKPNSYKKVLIADEKFSFLFYLRRNMPEAIIILEDFDKGDEWKIKYIPKNFKPDFYASFLLATDDNHIKFLKENDLMTQKIVYGVDKSNLKLAEKMGFHHIIFDYEKSFGEVDTFYNPVN